MTTRIIPADAPRWTAGRKLQLLSDIERGRVTHAEARERYNLSAEELASWTRRADRFGTKGLMVGRLQECRP